MARQQDNANGSGPVSLRAWAAEAAAAVEVARQMVPTEFVPEGLRVYEDDAKEILNFEATVQTVAMVLLAGQELGFPPMAALRAITIIKKTVGLYALAARALLLREGHEIEIKESTSTRAIVDGRRLGGEWQRSTWDIPRATLAGLYPGTQYSNWRKQPKSMLVARATAEACRWVAADALLALPVMVEEIQDQVEGAGAPLAIEGGAATSPGAVDGAGGPVPPEKPKRTAQRSRRPRVGDLPAGPRPPAPVPPDTGPPDVPPPLPDEPRIGKVQRQRIVSGLEDIGKAGSAEEALKFVATAAGRDVKSTGDLTALEADAVLTAIDTLRKVAGAPPADAQDAAAEAGDPPPPEEPAQ